MQIRAIEPIAVGLPMRKPVIMAGEQVRRADNMLVRIEADNGLTGWGEAASAPTMTGETIESMIAAVHWLAGALTGRPAADIDGAHAAMDACLYGNHGAKAAIEIALLRSSRKVHRAAGACAARREEAPAHAAARRDRRRRFRRATCAMPKRKKRRASPSSRSRSASIRRRTTPRAAAPSANVLGRDMLISADANQGFHARRKPFVYVRAVDGCGLDFFEQPVMADDLAGMAAVAAATRSPSAPTKAFIRSTDISRHHERKAARGVSLKAIKLGGIRAASAKRRGSATASACTSTFPARPANRASPAPRRCTWPRSSPISPGR